MPEFETIDAYIKSHPEEVQGLLGALRKTILNEVPDSDEAIRYDMPTITMDGASVVHFAAWKHHIGLYPVPEMPPEIERDVEQYRSGNATVKFPLNEPVPFSIVKKIVRVLVAEHLE